MFSHITVAYAFCWVLIMGVAADSEEIGGQDSCEPELGRALLQTRHSRHQFKNRRTQGVGTTAELNETGFQEVVAKCCTIEMVKFFKRVIEKEKRQVCVEGGVPGVAVWHDCAEDNGSYEGLLAAIRKGEQGDCAWLSPLEEPCPDISNRSSECPTSNATLDTSCSEEEEEENTDSSVGGEDGDGESVPSDSSGGDEDRDSGVPSDSGGKDEKKTDPAVESSVSSDPVTSDQASVDEASVLSTDKRKCTVAEIAGNEYFAHEKTNSKTGNKYCYHVTVKGEIEQSSYDFDVNDCNSKGFKRQFAVGKYKSQLSDFEEHYADGDMTNCKEVAREGYLIVEQDLSATESLIEVNEETACKYHFKLTVPSCSAPAQVAPPIHNPNVPRDCLVSELGGRTFFVHQAENEQTGYGYCYKLGVKGTIEQTKNNHPKNKCNDDGFNPNLLIGTYSKDISATEELYEKGDKLSCPGGKKRKGYLIVQTDPYLSDDEVIIGVTEDTVCEYHFRLTVKTCQA